MKNNIKNNENSAGLQYNSLSFIYHNAGQFHQWWRKDVNQHVCGFTNERWKYLDMWAMQKVLWGIGRRES